MFFRRSGTRSGGLAWALVFLSTWMLTPAAGAQDFFGTDFEAFTGIPAEAADPIAEEELDDLRGGFLGFYFSVNFSGVVDAEGAVDGSLDVNAGFGSESGNLSFEGDPTGTAAEGGSLGGPSVVVKDNVTGEAFRVQALVADNAFNNFSGALVLSQVPGNQNSVFSGLELNLAILQATPGNMAALQQRLDSFFGIQ